MDFLIPAWNTSSVYPLNLLYQISRKNVLETYAELIKERSKVLFCEDQSVVDFWQCNFPGQEFKLKTVNSKSGLHQHLRIGSSPKKHDPTSQFIFLHAGHSRDSLKVTREVFTAILSYHHVMPSFLDFVFSFGKQRYPEDFHFSGFKDETRLAPADRGLRIPELGRSGKTLQVCYSLRSVERAPEEPVPWSIRQTAFYHSLDVESGQASWIIIKGNDGMKNRIIQETQGTDGPDLRSYDTLPQCFSSALATHLLFCEWSAENWRWYVNLLEEKVQDITRRTLDKAIYTPEQTATIYGEPSKEQTTSTKTVKRSWTFKAKAPPRVLTLERFSGHEETQMAHPAPMDGPKSNGRPPPPVLPPGLAPMDDPKPNGRPPPPVLPPGVKQETTTAPQQAPAVPYQPELFQFDEVRRIQLIEERANETLLILKTNTNVQEELKQYYCSLASADDFPFDIKQLCERSLANFEKRISSLQNNFRMQQARLETLLRLLADRKTLLYGILDFQNMQSSKALAERGQQSAESMGALTEQMHKIAVQTKQETVSMKIITLVTLFFLPGTFISTLMSTDIIQFQGANNEKDGEMFSLPALKLFLVISLPMMFLTFVAWGAIYYYVKWRDAKNKSNKQDIEHNDGPTPTNSVDQIFPEKHGSHPRQSTNFSGYSNHKGSVRLSDFQWKSWFSKIQVP